MIRRYLDLLGQSIKGPGYRLDPLIPLSVLVGFGLRRALMLLRGLLLFRVVSFVGASVRIENRRYLRVGRGATLQENVVIEAFSRDGVTIGNRTNIGPYTRIQASGVLTRVGGGFRIGSDSGVGAFSFFGCGGGVVIGDNVIMGQYVSFHAENHYYSDALMPIRCQGTRRVGIKIGNNCWVGAKVTFLDGCVVGNGVVVAAGSVVRGDIPDDVVVAGVPARVIGSRTRSA